MKARLFVVCACQSKATPPRQAKPSLPGSRPVIPGPLISPARLGRLAARAHKGTRRSRSEFKITLTDDKDIAAAAIIGESRIPKKG